MKLGTWHLYISLGFRESLWCCVCRYITIDKVNQIESAWRKTHENGTFRGGFQSPLAHTANIHRVWLRQVSGTPASWESLSNHIDKSETLQQASSKPELPPAHIFISKLWICHSLKRQSLPLSSLLMNSFEWLIVWYLFYCRTEIRNYEGNHYNLDLNSQHLHKHHGSIKAHWYDNFEQIPKRAYAWKLKWNFNLFALFSLEKIVNYNVYDCKMLPWEKQVHFSILLKTVHNVKIIYIKRKLKYTLMLFLLKLACHVFTVNINYMNYLI